MIPLLTPGRRAFRAAFAILAVPLWTIACGQAGDAGPSPVQPAPARADVSGYSFRPEERRAVEGFLERNRTLRVATDADRRVAEEEAGEVGGLYGVYHPYFVRGDLNDDGVLDFVLAFVRRDSSRDTPWFSVVVFSGRDRGGRREFAQETFLERDISLADGDLAIDRDAILITPDLSAETTRRYRWDPSRHSYVFVRQDEDAVEPPDVART
jgi:hypothetical protein